MENLALPRDRLKKKLRLPQGFGDEIYGEEYFLSSGGEKQKIAFASVYAMNPSVYLLDEPSSNLDMESVVALREHIKRLKAQGKTVFNCRA